jgi:NADPH:quinone reductase-like Zn-dependent oxidoreductase
MDKVYGLTTFSGLGNARSVTVAEENELALMPSNIAWEEAATVPLSALTAWQALFVHGGLTPPSITSPEGGRIGTGNEGKRVLVTAASGGVGIWAVQLAHQAGAIVVGSCGPSNLDFVKNLGAETAIDYVTISLPDWVGTDKETKGFDVVVDCVGGGTLSDGWHCARRGGRVIGVAEDPAGFRPGRGVAEGVVGRFFIVEANGEQLHEVTKLIEQKRCKAVVDSVFDLEEWEKAFEKAGAGHAKGKVVLKIDRGRLDDTDDNVD